MPAPTYTKDEAATHEIGHAAVAWALALEIEVVLVEPMPAPAAGWRGHCRPVLVPRGTYTQGVLDGFMLGGPISQLINDTQALGNHAALFQPTLFSNTPQLFGGLNSPLNQLRWQSDFLDTEILYIAPGSPNRLLNELRFGARPWLAELELRLRTYMEDPAVRAFVCTLQPQLVAANQLAPAQVKEAFDAIPVATWQGLRAFAATCV